MRCSSIHWMTPTCANPKAPPPSSTRPIVGRLATGAVTGVDDCANIALFRTVIRTKIAAIDNVVMRRRMPHLVGLSPTNKVGFLIPTLKRGLDGRMLIGGQSRIGLLARSLMQRIYHHPLGADGSSSLPLALDG